MAETTPNDETDLAEAEEDFDEEFEDGDEPALEDVVVEDDEDLLADDAKPAKKASGKAAKASAKSSGGDDDEEDEEDDFDADDVEEDLGEILKARLATAAENEDDDEEEGTAALDSEDRSNNANRVRPKRPEEFVCQSCFLVKHPSQLADAKHQLCSDCV